MITVNIVVDTSPQSPVFVSLTHDSLIQSAVKLLVAHTHTHTHTPACARTHANTSLGLSVPLFPQPASGDALLDRGESAAPKRIGNESPCGPGGSRFHGSLSALVDRLASAARDAGALIRVGVAVKSVQQDEGTRVGSSNDSCIFPVFTVTIDFRTMSVPFWK